MIMCLFIISLVSASRSKEEDDDVILFVFVQSTLLLCNYNLCSHDLIFCMCVCVGNGKVKTKEPLEMANKAIVQLKEALDLASQSD